MKLSERIFKYGIFTLDTTEVYDGVLELEADSQLLEDLIEMLFDWDIETMERSKAPYMHGVSFPENLLGGVDRTKHNKFEYWSGRVNYATYGSTPREAIEAAVKVWKEKK